MRTFLQTVFLLGFSALSMAQVQELGEARGSILEAPLPSLENLDNPTTEVEEEEKEDTADAEKTLPAFLSQCEDLGVEEAEGSDVGEVEVENESLASVDLGGDDALFLSRQGNTVYLTRPHITQEKVTLMKEAQWQAELMGMQVNRSFKVLQAGFSPNGHYLSVVVQERLDDVERSHLVIYDIRPITIRGFQSSSPQDTFLPQGCLAPHRLRTTETQTTLQGMDDAGVSFTDADGWEMRYRFQP